LNKIRFKFIRGEEVKYISHLDLMKVYDRAIRRANIPIAYSQGFNPHPQIVFGLPLSVGVTSEAEYADFELSEPMDLTDFKQRLGSEMPAGLRIIDAEYNNTKNNIMSDIAASSYEILVYSDEELNKKAIEEKVRQLLGESEVVIKRESKGKVKEVDIRPMIHRLEAGFLVYKNLDKEKTEDFLKAKRCSNKWLVEYASKLCNTDIQVSNYSHNNIFSLYMLVSAGSMANLKPELLITALNKVTGSDLRLLKIHRTGLFVSKEGKLLEPLDTAVLSDK
jgi:radical SAM-linked protein